MLPVGAKHPAPSRTVIGRRQFGMVTFNDLHADVILGGWELEDGTCVDEATERLEPMAAQLRDLVGRFKTNAESAKKQDRERLPKAVGHAAGAH